MNKNSIANINNQKELHNKIYSDTKRFEFHFTEDRLTRYLRDRRLGIVLKKLSKKYGDRLKNFKILVTCGGVGGEAYYFYRNGFSSVYSTDISDEGIELGKSLFPGISFQVEDSEALSFSADSFDIVIVQDGLHHLPRPCQGLTEMLRVSQKCVVVIEPRLSVTGLVFGRKFERNHDIENYVFRWSKSMLANVSYSYRLRRINKIEAVSLFDHSLFMLKLFEFIPNHLKLICIRFIYSALRPFGFLGNILIGIIHIDEN